jgi:hypothetical protein
MVISAERATLHELQTVYGVADLFNLAEVIGVDAHNRREITRHADHN